MLSTVTRPGYALVATLSKLQISFIYLKLRHWTSVCVGGDEACWSLARFSYRVETFRALCRAHAGGVGIRRLRRHGHYALHRIRLRHRCSADNDAREVFTINGRFYHWQPAILRECRIHQTWTDERMHIQTDHCSTAIGFVCHTSLMTLVSWL